MATILVIEDDTALRETLVYNLTRDDYTVQAEGNGLAGLQAARKIHPDLILLDLMLPGMDGIEVCRLVRQEMNIPILILTARDDEIDRVIGLEIGADDYITKPFSMRELMARVKAHLRRDRLIRQEAEGKQEEVSQDRLTFGNLTIDVSRREVLMEHAPINLKPKEFDLLLFMAQHYRQALSRQFLLERVWGWEYGGGTRTVDVHVHWLREKIEVDAANPTRLVTVRGSGYRFEGK
ncbi:MAG: response regulator transcription factor [Anaerolineae bacterium]|nr:response regulator transcription factor [Anaerolineae bacterium]